MNDIQSVTKTEEETSLDDAQLWESVQLALAEADRKGASAAEAAASLSQGLTINVRKGDLETVEHTRDHGLIVSVYFGQRTGDHRPRGPGHRRRHGDLRGVAERHQQREDRRWCTPAL